jgi:hypothetical protein
MPLTRNDNGVQTGTISNFKPGVYYIVTSAGTTAQVLTEEGWRPLPSSKTVRWVSKPGADLLSFSAGTVNVFTGFEVIT